ncbi:MAG: methionyl-tRNA formyltransferase [Acidobacteriaceae bacterium]
MRLVFCGTPQFAVPTLEHLLLAGHTIELVLAQPDRPGGRGLAIEHSPVKQFALSRGLSLAQPEKIRNNPELQQRLVQLAPDAIVIVAYGRLIPSWMLALPPHGNLNLHASLLPKYRGAAPIQWAVANGETETGVTTMRIDEGLDTGDILLQQRLEISPQQTALDLFPMLATQGANLMVQTLSGLAEGTLQPRPQEGSLATLAPILTREDGRIDWGRPAQQIYDRWRGFQPWPGAFTILRGKKLSVHSLHPEISEDIVLPRETSSGALIRSGSRLFAACGAGSWVELLELQWEGKRRMPVGAFLNGVQIASGERLG